MRQMEEKDIKQIEKEKMEFLGMQWTGAKVDSVIEEFPDNNIPTPE